MEALRNILNPVFAQIPPNVHFPWEADSDSGSAGVATDGTKRAATEAQRRGTDGVADDIIVDLNDTTGPTATTPPSNSSTHHAGTKQSNDNDYDDGADEEDDDVDDDDDNSQEKSIDASSDTSFEGTTTTNAFAGLAALHGASNLINLNDQERNDNARRMAEEAQRRRNLESEHESAGTVGGLGGKRGGGGGGATGGSGTGNPHNNHNNNNNTSKTGSRHRSALVINEAKALDPDAAPVRALVDSCVGTTSKWEEQRQSLTGTAQEELLSKDEHKEVVGSICLFEPSKGYGFVAPDCGGPDLYFTRDSLEDYHLPEPSAISDTAAQDPLLYQLLSVTEPAVLQGERVVCYTRLNDSQQHGSGGTSERRLRAYSIRPMEGHWAIPETLRTGTRFLGTVRNFKPEVNRGHLKWKSDAASVAGRDHGGHVVPSGRNNAAAAGKDDTNASSSSKDSPNPPSSTAAAGLVERAHTKGFMDALFVRLPSWRALPPAFHTFVPEMPVYYYVAPLVEYRQGKAIALFVTPAPAIIPPAADGTETTQRQRQQQQSLLPPPTGAAPEHLTGDIIYDDLDDDQQQQQRMLMAGEPATRRARVEGFGGGQGRSSTDTGQRPRQEASDVTQQQSSAQLLLLDDDLDEW